jgi:hypothetical protein
MKLVRANIQNSAKLREANRVLLEDIRVSLSNMYDECETLSRNVAVKPKSI